MLTLIRAGAFDAFGDPRPVQFWQARSLGFWPKDESSLFPPSAELTGLPSTLTAPDPAAVLRDEDELFGFTVTAHPLDLHTGIAWNTYCPIARLGDYPGQRVTTCGLIITERLHSQSSGDTMKFIILSDYTGFIECEIFAHAYRRWGLATVRWPVVEVEGTVSMFDNNNGFTLDVQRVAQPRRRVQT